MSILEFRHLGLLLTAASMLVALTAWLVTLQREESFLDRQVQVLRHRIERLEKAR